MLNIGIVTCLGGLQCGLVHFKKCKVYYLENRSLQPDVHDGVMLDLILEASFAQYRDCDMFGWSAMWTCTFHGI